MIIKASQRGNAAELARHLMNGHDNEHVEVHSIEGFMGNNIHEALEESHAISLGTKCSQHLFSVSFNPPKEAQATIKDFEEAIQSAAKKMGLANQPHVIVFHEKEGRRHAHCVWSRIDGQEMKAINLPYFKNKMVELSKELYMQHGWNMPKGFIDKSLRNPLNFTLAEWQQAKRNKTNPRMIKHVVQQCWKKSQNTQQFSKALKQHGFYLARGDRRGFVLVNWRGDVNALSRMVNEKAKAIQQKLGSPDALPSVQATKDNIDQAKVKRLQEFHEQIMQGFSPQKARLEKVHSRFKERHTSEREDLAKRQQKRQIQERGQRTERLRKGFGGLWDKLIGKQRRIREQNQHDAYECHLRDQAEKDTLIFKQIQERQNLQTQQDKLKSQEHQRKMDIQRAVFGDMPEEQMKMLMDAPEQASQKQLKTEFDMSM